MSDYPNIDMMLRGCTSGSTQEWPVLRKEAARLLTELDHQNKLLDEAAAREAELRRALEGTVQWIVDLAESGDAGWFDPEDDFAVKTARAALALSPGEAVAGHDGLADYLRDAREFSGRTFGPGRRTLGVTKHIEKEIAEVRAKPDDLTEWVDIIILAADGYWRHGGQPENLLADMKAKLAKNKARTWPAPTSEDEPIEHDRTHDDPLNPKLGPEHREFWARKANGEALLCDNAGTDAPECLTLDAEERKMFGLCPRCRALAEAKGGE